MPTALIKYPELLGAVHVVGRHLSLYFCARGQAADSSPVLEGLSEDGLSGPVELAAVSGSTFRQVST